MKTHSLPLLAALALVGTMSLTVSLGAALMLILAAGVGAIIQLDYACRYRGLRLPRRRYPAVTANYPWTAGREPNRLAA